MSWRCCDRRHDKHDYEGIGHDFHLPGSKKDFLPNYGFNITSIDIELTPDFNQQSISANTLVTCKVNLPNGQSRFKFEQRELSIQQVSVVYADGSEKAARFEAEDLFVTAVTENIK